MKNSKENRGSDRELVGARTKTPASTKDANHRVQRVEREIREVVGSYLISGFRGPLPGMVSITRVVSTKDLRSAKIFVTVLSLANPKAKTPAQEKAVAQERDSAIEILNAHAFEVQNEINRCLKMKYCPKVTFIYDEGYENVMKVERILRDIGQEKAKTQTKVAPDAESSDSDSN